MTACQESSSNKTLPKAKTGQIDLTSWDFSGNGAIELSGEWQFYWRKLMQPANLNTTTVNHDLIHLPKSWNGHTINGEVLSGNSFATYHLLIKHQPQQERVALKLLNMSSAYKLWINGEVLAQNGVVAGSKALMRPQYKPIIAAFSMAGTESELVLQVANFHHRKGGAWNPIVIGLEAEIREQQRYRDFFDMFLFGVLFIMAFYHFGLYFLRRKDSSTLYFGLFCLVIALRSLLYREMNILMFYPDIPWQWIQTARYLLTFSCIPIFALFIRSLYPLETRSKITELFIAAASCLMLVVVVTPLSFYSQAMPLHEGLSILLIIYVMYIVVRAVKNGHQDARWFLIGLIPLALIIVNDILSSKGIINTVMLLPLGLFLFIFFQAIILALRFSRSFERVENLTQAYERFVPNKFLEHLQQDDIVNVRLGDHTQRTMTILFSDIRAFTTMSETMTPQENFNFLNAYLERMEPLIMQSDGFIDKYIGDEIMALFEKDPDDAVKAGIAMLKTLAEYNQQRIDLGYEVIRIGVGINTGDLMLGIIGGKNRMDGTVISDAVNLASRMEKLTKEYKTPLLISGYTYKKLRRPEQYYIRAIDLNVKVPGKQNAVVIYEVYDNDPEAVKQGKLTSQQNFALALELYTRQEMVGAMRLFKQCLAATPEDKVAQFYIRRIEAIEGMH